MKGKDVRVSKRDEGGRAIRCRRALQCSGGQDSSSGSCLESLGTYYPAAAALNPK